LDLGAVLLTGALFRLDKVNQYSNNATPVPTYVQDGRQVHQGLELTATGKATKCLTVVGGVMLAHERVTQSNNPAVDGKRPTLAATSSSQPVEQMAKLYAEYSVPGTSGLVLTGGVYHMGNSYADTLNTTEVPSYTIGDAGARYETRLGGCDTTFRLNVTNVTNKAYWSSSCTVGMPRTAMVSASVKL